VLARKVLLDALSALEPYGDAFVLVGAQAIYLHTGDADLAVAEYTTDGDLAIGPSDLADTPLLADALRTANLQPGDQLGRWVSPEGVYVDLLVPEALAGPGRRGADLGPHGRLVARQAKGLEAALVDRSHRTLTALDPADRRSFETWVADPAALLVAKVHKIAERLGSPNRVRDKDALDVLRLLRAIDTAALAGPLNVLAQDELSASVTIEARSLFEVLFTTRNAEGVEMAVRAAGTDEDPETIAASTISLASDLLEIWRAANSA